MKLTITVLALSVTLNLIYCSQVKRLAARYQISELHQVCIRYIDSEGYLRGRDALFNTKGATDQLGTRYTHYGGCVPGEQGPTKRVKLCLVMSSRCLHDRTTEVWDDQVEYYLKKYPESYHGTCKEGTELPDDCIEKSQSIQYGPMKLNCLQYDKQCKP